MIWTILIGFVIGVVAKFLMPGRDPAGFIITVVLGIVGSWFAGFLGAQMGFYAPYEPVGFIASVIGAMLVLFIYRSIKNK